MLERYKTWLILSILIITYVPIYVPLYLALGGVANALVLVPVIVVGWIFGMRGGLLAGVLSYPLEVLFAAILAEGGAWEMLFPDGVFGHIIVVIGGAVVGWLHDLGERVKEQAFELEGTSGSDGATMPERTRQPSFVT